MAIKLKPRWTRLALHSEREARPVRIVADAAIATGRVGDGRLIVLVILDTTERPDLEEFIRIHQHFSPGDVEAQWATLRGSRRKVSLILSFKRPAELVAILEFDIVKQGILVDQLLATKGLYIQAGRDGDRFVKNPDAPKVLVEIPDTGFRKAWDHIFHQHIVDHMKSRGLPRRDAKRAASQYLEEWRKFGQFRMRRTENLPE